MSAAGAAALVVALANARSVRRPSGAPEPFFDDALRDAGSAGELLGPFLEQPVEAGDLPALRVLQVAVAGIADALIDGSPPPLDQLNALAQHEPATYELERLPGGELRPAIRPRRSSVAASLLFEVVGELGRLEPSRLRRCARPECGLVFYDATRSGTQRWHAERPCGLRERQRRHRAAHSR